MASTSTFVALVAWVIAHGYFLFFVAAFFEGPLITTAAGVASALGYYSLPIIILLSVLADLSADVVYYTIGYWGRRTLITRYGHYVGLTKERLDKLERMLHRHTRKALFVVKLSPLIPVPGLIVIGSARVPLKRFVAASLIITLPKSLIFGLLGFFSGRAYEHLSGVIANSEYAFFALVIVVMIVYFAYQQLTKYLSREMEK